MFAEIAPRYDFVNRMLSGGIDTLWRRFTVKHAPPPPTGSVLDVCTGTGDLALTYAAKVNSQVRVVGSDFCRPMLDRGIEKSATRNLPVEWIEADVTTWKPDRSYDIWHDRAVFHFLIDAEDRTAYRDRLCGCLIPGGHAIIATFALDGPEKCSGLPVVRYEPEGLRKTLGERFSLVAQRMHRHTTPWGSPQSFQFSLLRMDK